MDAGEIVLAIRRQLERRNTTAYRAALDAGLPGNAIRYALEGRSTKSERLAEICNALGLEFYIGPPRDESGPESPPVSAPPEIVEALDLAPDASLEEAIAAIEAKSTLDATALHEEMAAVKEETHALREEIAERFETVPRLSSPGSLEDASALAPAPGFGEKQELRHVEVVQFAAAAGGGAEAFEERQIGTLAFCRGWMDRHGLRTLDCAVINVRGDSMEPTLWDGASILLDKSRSDWQPGNIFVVRTPDGVVVKRASEDEAGNQLMVSDSASPDWPDLPLPDNAEIIGRVVWTARTLIG